MARGGGIALKALQWALRGVEFCCAAVVFAIYVYFLASLHNHEIDINNYIRSVTGISGVAIIYTVIAVLLVCCLGGFGFFALIAVILDLAFVGAFIYVAYETRGGASSCNGIVNTPFGNGDSNDPNFSYGAKEGFTALPSLRTACRLQTATFSVAIIAIVFFFLSAILEVFMWRHHKSEKKYGPSPANNYTTGGQPRRFWQRKPRQDAYASGGRNNDSLPVHSTPGDMRNSYATDHTAVGTDPMSQQKVGHYSSSNY